MYDDDRAPPGPRRARARGAAAGRAAGCAGGRRAALDSAGASSRMSTLFVTDPLDGLHADIDASVGLMDACQTEGAEVWVCEPADLGVAGGRLTARARRIALRPRQPGRRPPVARRADLVRRGAARDARRRRDLRAGVAADRPAGRRALPAHDLPARPGGRGRRPRRQPPGRRPGAAREAARPRLPDLCPATLVTAAAAEVEAFVAAYGTAVVKPVDGFAGTDVWLLEPGRSCRALAESATAGGPARDRAGVPARGGRRQQAAVPGRRRDRRRGARAGPADEDFRIGPPVAAAADRRRRPPDRGGARAAAGRPRHRDGRPRRDRRPADRGQRDLPRRHAQDRRAARHRPQRRDRAPPAHDPHCTREEVLS